MIKFTLNRLKGTPDMTFGELTEPKYGFRCYTMERAVRTRPSQQNYAVALAEGEYKLKPMMDDINLTFGIHQSGYLRKARFEKDGLISNTHYGSIVVGSSYDGESIDGIEHAYKKFVEFAEYLMIQGEFSMRQKLGNVMLEIKRDPSFVFVTPESNLVPPRPKDWDVTDDEW